MITWLFWPALAGYLFWHQRRTYAWAAVVSPFLITAMLYGMAAVEPDTPLFLALMVHGIVAARLIAEHFRNPD